MASMPLKGQTVGVVGGEANHPVVDAIKQEYDLSNKKVVFKDLALADVSPALHSKQVNAVLFVAPVTEKYLSVIRTAFQGYGKKTPTPIAIEEAGAIANVARAYESYDLPKGTIWGSPPVPDDDLTTLRVPFYLVANKKLNDDDVANLTRAIMNARRELIAEFPLLAQISSPSTDKDAFIPIHPGAAEYYGDTQQSFLDKYSNELYYGPMAFGALASGLVAAWKFLGLGGRGKGGSPLDPLYAMARRIRLSKSEGELTEIEEEIDTILKTELTKTATNDEAAIDPGIMSLAAHRLEYLIQYRRTMSCCDVCRDNMAGDVLHLAQSGQACSGGESMTRDQNAEPAQRCTPSAVGTAFLQDPSLAAARSGKSCVCSAPNRGRGTPTRCRTYRSSPRQGEVLLRTR